MQRERYPYKSVMLVIYVFLTLFFGFLMCMYALEGNDALLDVLPFLQIPAGLLVIFATYRFTGLIATPLTYFALVWMVLVPATSGQWPLMEKMSLLQWRVCVAGGIAFALGGLVSCTLGPKKIYERQAGGTQEFHLTHVAYGLCLGIMGFSILYFCFLCLVNGYIPIQSSGMDTAYREFFDARGSALLTNIAVPAAFAVFCDRRLRKRKLYVALLLSYGVISLLTGVRFIATLTVLMFFSTVRSVKLRRKDVKWITITAALVVAVFYVMMEFRGGAAHKELFFISTGRYYGSAGSLVATEFARYIGMSQRVMEQYIAVDSPGVAAMGFTLSPILRLAGLAPSVDMTVSLSGYTAKNVLAYLYLDAGYYGFAVLALLSVLVHVVYYGYLDKPFRLFRKYCWSVATIALLMSFYCYVNAYPYWLVEYPIVILMINAINNRTSGAGASIGSIEPKEHA